MTSTSINYYIQSCSILEKYSLSSLLEGVPVESINLMINEHRLELQAIDTYEQAIALGNRVLSNMSGFNIQIRTFIPSDVDLRALYSVLMAWRDSILPVEINI